MAAHSEVRAIARSLDSAIDSAASHLWSKQCADGSWNVVADMGPACTAQVAVALAWASVLRDEEKAAIERFLRSQQRDDGSFLPYPYARGGTASATASAWAALVACGVDARDDAVVRAQHFVYAHGGLQALEKALVGGELSPLYLALVGLLPPSHLPRLPLGWASIDPLVDGILRVVHGGVPFGALQLGIIARALRGEPIDARAADKLRDWIDLWQNRDGSINANALQTAVTLVALRAVGEREGDRRFDLAVRSLRSLARNDEHGMWFGTFESDVWTTALDLRALLSAGAGVRDARVVRAVEYLLRCQSETPQPVVNNRRPDAVRTGGWAFQRDNVTMVDNDDTGMVLSVLGHWVANDTKTDLLHDSVERAIARGRAFLTSMQNSDGGFSAFVRDLPKRRPGPIMDRGVERPSSLSGWAAFVKNPPASLGDPSTEDVTARALLGLARTGSARNDESVQAALAFLRRFQQPNGSWWGRWVVNYVPSTAYVVSACAALGITRDTPWLERAVQWLLSLQNADGGWGEWVDSYVEPSRAGLAPSTPPLTALVLSALLDVGLSDDAAVHRAADYLLATQLPQGGWSNRDYLAVFVPPDAFYEYPGTNDYAPLDALARYRALSRARVTHVAPVDQRHRLEDLTTRGDPLADEAAAALDADKQWGALFAALATGRTLPEVAAPVRALIDAASRLPSSIDPARVLEGQRFFARHSWAMGNAFFFASMPASYAIPRGAEVLMRSGPLANDVRRRLLDTGHFMWAVMTPSSFAEGGNGFREVLRVRLVHARVRRALLARGWPREKGDPIDQASMLGTTLVLSWVALHGLERLGVLVPEQDGEALLHAWRAVGALTGVEEEVLPRSLAEAAAQADYFRRTAWGRSDAGSTLARELVEAVRAYLPLRALDDWPIDMIRHTAGDELADILELPPGGRTRPLIVRAAEFLRHEGSRLSPIDNLVHGLTVGVIEVQRLPMMFAAALQRAFEKREHERRAVDPAETDAWDLPAQR